MTEHKLLLLYQFKVRENLNFGLLQLNKPRTYIFMFSISYLYND